MSDERDSEKQAVANVFSRAASTYDRVGPPFFAHFGKRLADLAKISHGSQVLDVAAGRGAILFPSVEHVGPQGRVIAIDLSDAMVKETGEEIHRRGIPNAEIRQMDAEQLEFPDSSFDYVLSGFSLFFFPQVERALAEFRRVLKVHGQIVVSTWDKSDEKWRWYQDSLKLYQPERKNNPLKDRSPIFDTTDGMETLMSNSGFSEIQVIPEEYDFVYANEEEWWNMMWTHGGRRPLEKMPADILEKFKADVLDKIQLYNKQPDGIHHLLRVLFTIARKPSE